AVITRWGGSVTSSATDEFLAVFGHPMGHEDDAERAVHAGLELVKNVGEGGLLPSGQVPQVRIGIATGLVLVGENQVAVGGALIAAARLRNITPPNSVMIETDTHKLLGNVFAYEHAGAHRFDMGSEEVIAYRITEKRVVESRFAARQARNLT